jgi:hypothetical protein
MSLSTFIAVMATAFVLALAGVVYIKVSHRNLLKKRTERRELMARAQKLQLPQMLQSLGIGIGRYFYKMPLPDLNDSIVLCENCSAAEQCKQKLRIPELNPEDVEFCPNLNYLDQHSRARRIRG